MSNDQANLHREQARQIAERVVSEWNTTPPYVAGTSSENLINAISDALSSRDAEIREVLEGFPWIKTGDNMCWCSIVLTETHAEYCLAARALWEKVQPKGSSDVTE